MACAQSLWSFQHRGLVQYVFSTSPVFVCARVSSLCAKCVWCSFPLIWNTSVPEHLESGQKHLIYTLLHGTPKGNELLQGKLMKKEARGGLSARLCQQLAEWVPFTFPAAAFLICKRCLTSSTHTEDQRRLEKSPKVSLCLRHFSGDGHITHMATLQPNIPRSHPPQHCVWIAEGGARNPEGTPWPLCLPYCIA